MLSSENDEVLYHDAATVEAVAAFHATEAQPLILVGPPGVGKSEIIGGVARRHGMEVVYFDTTSSEPTDVGGLPFPVVDDNGNRILKRLLFERLRQNRPMALFFDEVYQGRPEMLNAIAPVFLERRLGDHVLPSTTWVVGATNRKVDRAGVTRPPSHLPNRVTTVGLEFRVEAWRKWAIAERLPTEVCGFAAFRPSLIYDFDPARQVNATPRQWAWIANRLDKIWALPHAARIATLSGRVGAGPACEFSAFLESRRDLPSIDEILLDPAGEKVPAMERADQMFAVTCAVAGHVTDKTLATFARYMSRFPEEFQVLWLRDSLIHTNNELLNNREFVDLCGQHKHLLVAS